MAINAQLGDPSGVAVDANGNVYIADQFNSVVRKINGVTGIIATVAGLGQGAPLFSGDNGPATNARLFFPHSVTVDASGNIYIADTGNQRIRKVTASTGIITTVAGNGTGAYSGDNEPATAASIFNPTAIAVDNNGNIFIADYENNRIRRVDNSTGIITTVAGTGALGFTGDNSFATSAQLSNPSGVAIDGGGNLLIADTYNQRIRKVDLLSGIIVTITGNGVAGSAGDNGPATSAQLNVPQGITLDGSGNLYIADYASGKIRKVAAGTITTVAGNGGFGGDGGPATASSIKYPNGVGVDAAGNIYFADQYNNRIRKIDKTTGNITTISGNGNNNFSGDNGLASSATLNWPRGVSLDSDGNIYFADASNNRIRKINMTTNIIITVAGNGNNGFGGDGGLAINAQLAGPMSVALDGIGNLYIADHNNHRIRKVVMSTGIITTIAGNGTSGFSGDDNLATNAQLYYPYAVAFDGSNNMYIADWFNSRVRKVNVSTGIITTFAGNGNGVGAIIPSPTGLAFSAAGDLYVTDGSKVRKIDGTTGIISTFAGSAVGYAGDGGAAANAQFKFLTSIKIDVGGNMYLSDSENNRVRKIAAKAAQTITFNTLPAKAFGETPFVLTATTSSGLTVTTFTSNNLNVATVNGQTLTIVGAGISTITAIQAGDLDYLPAPGAPQTLTVNKGNQTITFPAIVGKAVGNAPFIPVATATSGLSVSLSSLSDKISITANQISLIKAGRANIKADQAGNANYNVAPSAEQSFCLNPTKPVITTSALNTETPLLTSSNDTGNQWYLNGTAINLATAKTYTVKEAGSYTVRTTVEDCASELSDPLIIIITGDINAFFKTEIAVYPNPVENLLIVNIKSPDQPKATIEMIDLLGRRVQIREVNTNEDQSFDVGSMGPGVYFIMVAMSEKSYHKKFLKK